MIINNIGINFAGGGGGSEAKLESKDYNLTANGSTTIRPSSGYDGISGGTIQVNVDMQPAYNSGYTEGYASGYTSGETDGYSTGYASGYTSGETAGMAEQKALLTSTTITENGSYTRENGYSAVTVNVPQIGGNRLNQYFNNQITSVTQSDLSGMALVPDSAFANKTNIVSVDLPSTITALSRECFANTGIVTLDTSNVHEVGSGVFKLCNNLTGLTGFDNVTSATPSQMFLECHSLSGDLRTSITSGGYNVFDKTFSYCENLRSITFLKNIETLTNSYSWNAPFENCTGIEYLDLTRNYQVPSLGATWAFSAFTANYEIRVPQFLYDEWTAATNWNDSAIVNHIVAYPNPHPTVVNRYTVTDGTKITPNVAYNNSSWGGLFISDDFDATTGGTVTMYGEIIIPENAYYYNYTGNTRMKTYEIGDGVKSIGYQGFRNNNSLESISIPDSVTLIDGRAFQDCIKLTAVTIGSGVTSIGRIAFSNCNRLQSITIPDSVTSIGDTAFYGCTALTSVTLSSNLSTIPEEFCYKCSSLSSITIPSNVTIIGARAFCDTVLSSVTIPDGVTILGSYAFANTKLTEVFIPDSVTRINNSSDGRLFIGCSLLETVRLSNNITEIPENTFSGCAALSAITIPSGVTSIGSNAFYRCSSLKTITCNAIIAPSIPTQNLDNPFGQMPSNGTLYIPSGSDYSSWLAKLPSGWTISDTL